MGKFGSECSMTCAGHVICTCLIVCPRVRGVVVIVAEGFELGHSDLQSWKASDGLIS